MRTIKVSRRRRARYGSFATSRRADGRTSGSSISLSYYWAGLFQRASLAASVLAFFRFGIKIDPLDDGPATQTHNSINENREYPARRMEFGRIAQEARKARPR
jgi:hypothetical protein